VAERWTQKVSQTAQKSWYKLTKNEVSYAINDNTTRL